MNRTRRSIFVLVTMVAILSLLLAACGDDDDEDGGDTDDTSVATATSSTGDAQGTPTAAASDETPAGMETPAGEETPAAEGTSSTGGATTTGDADAGQAIYEAQCKSCHTIDGSQGVGPSWQGIWMHDVTLDDGTTVTADADYITESIQDPTAKVAEGFQPIMPELGLSDDDINNVIAFIQTLE